jgi:hypothetical protein
MKLAVDGLNGGLASVSWRGKFCPCYAVAVSSTAH